MQNTTSFAQPKESFSLVYSAVSFMISPISLTASILIPVFVEPRLIDEHTLSVLDKASGIDLISISSAGVMPFDTSAENPPIKLTPTAFATSSSTMASSEKSEGVLQAAAPIKAIGVTEIRLFTIGIPNSFSISLPVFTRSFAYL